MSTQDALVVEHLSREFRVRGGSLDALVDVSFSVARGEIVALLGDNGAGKTTLARVVATLLAPTRGRAFVLGKDVVAQPRQARAHLGVVFGGDRGIYPRLSGRANLVFFATLAGVPRSQLRARVPELLEEVGLAAAADRRVETYSKGMRQRLHLAIGMAARPQVLLLDEPTIGLDPGEAQHLRERIATMREDGVSVLLTSHYLLDVERLADRVLVLEAGSLTMDEPLADFIARLGFVARCEVDIVAGALPEDPPDGIEVLSRSGHGGIVRVVLGIRRWGPATLRQLSDYMDRAEVGDMRISPTRLEDSYTAWTSGAE